MAKPGTFQKGNPGGPGRPKGSPDKKWHNLQWWFELVSENMNYLQPQERVDVGLRGIELLMSKMHKLPETPVESKENVDEFIGKLEGATIEPQTNDDDNANA